MILMIDNYDSFVFNLSRYVEELGGEVLVRRNDKITIDEINRLQPRHIILSPGPCSPDEAGICLELVRRFCGKIPILGICLGHQVLGQVFGGGVIKAKKPMHGKSSLIFHQGKGIFKGIPSPFRAGRYHSLIVSEQNLSDELEITSRSEENEIMSLASEKWKIAGLQFHPESILTEYGHDLIDNFLNSVF